MESTLTPSDLAYMRRAVELGRRGWGRVQPNPLVGCVVVKEDQVLGEGWHEELGGPHAEVLALGRAGSKAAGATVYVSLEPCNHFGRTPPCSEALRDAGVRRVVFGSADPGRKSGGGAEAMRSQGVEVVGPVLPRGVALSENPAFFFNSEKNATFVALKLAQTLDGRIAASPGRRTTITGAEAQREVHRLRAGFDAVLVGSETVRVDDPFLTVREEMPMRHAPARMVLDTLCQISPEAKLFRDVDSAPVIIYTSQRAPSDRVRRVRDAGARVERLPDGPGGLSLDAFLERAWEIGARAVLCEGGGRLAASFVKKRKAGRIYLFLAPFVLGESGVPAFPDAGGPGVWREWKRLREPKAFGEDVLLILDRME